MSSQIFRTFLKIEKRLRFVISAFLIGLLFIFSSFFEFNAAWVFVPAFILLAYFLTYFSVLEGIKKIEWLTLFLMPVLFSVSFYLFFHLFPIRWLTRVPFITVYIVSFYAISLTSNIFNVGVEKNLQLHRAAFSVNYFYQSLIFFIVCNVLLSFKANFFFNGLFVFLAVIPLSLQLLWTVHLEEKLSKDLLRYSLFNAMIMGEIAMLMSFVPLKSTLLSLFLTTCYYSISGATYHFIDQRLYKNVVKEYMIVFIVVSVLTVLSITW